MKKSLSLILSIALVFSMFSSLAFAADQSIGEKLKAAGVISGNSSGDLMEDQIWKREDLTVLAAKLLGVVEEAQAAGDTHDFDDVDNPYYDGFISYAKENGIFVGVSETSFGMNRGITAKQFAAVILRLLGFEFDYDTETEALAIEHGIFAEGTNWLQPAKRGDLYSALAAGIQVVGADGKTIAEKRNYVGFYEVSAEQKINSFKAVGAKKLELKMAAAVDTSKAEVSVKRGNFQSNVKEIKWSDDKTTATIEMVANLIKGEYTVTVSGVADKDLSQTISVDSEKVASININNTKAPVTSAANTAVYAFFNAVNQYGEDVTSTKMGDLNFNISRGSTDKTYKDGKLTINAPASEKFNIGDKIVFSVTYIGSDHSAFASETLEVSPMARVSTLDLAELYSKDGKELRNDSTAGDFGVIVNAKDQYGNNVSADQLNADVTVNVAGDSVGVADPVFGEVSNSGKLGIVFAGSLKAGTTSFFAVSTASGANDRFDVTVTEAPALHTLNLYAPEFAVAGEKIEIPFEAIDQFGNLVETEAAIKAGLIGEELSVSKVGEEQPTIKFNTDYVDDKVTLVLDTEMVTDLKTATTVIITATTKAHKFASVNISLQPNAKPEVITKVEGITGAIAEGGKTTIKPGNIKIVDQYGRTKDANFFSGYTVNVESSKESVVGLGAGNDKNVDMSGDLNLNGRAEGTSSITLKVKGVDNSDLSVNIKVVKKDSIVSYETSDVATLYAGGKDFARDLTVQGVLEDGTKVSVPNNGVYYSVTESVYGLYYEDGKLYAAQGGDVNKDVNGIDGEGTFVVVVSGFAKDGKVQPIIKELTISKKARVATTIEVQSKGISSKVADAYVSIAKVDLTDDVNKVVKDAVKVIDQYGFELSGQIASAYASVSKITDVAAGKDFTVTVVTNNAKVFEFKVRVK